MRTMKKVLALSLVLAMALGMMANAATFNDNDAINPDLLSDINLMIALNVFSEQGTGAGYFEPNRELTREEVAKLIYVLKNKGVDNGATSWTGMNIFKDIESGRWSEGYINYAASVGMMAGTGEGYFNPTAKMSAVEVAKLLLVLNGYKADVQGYLGTNWDINIIRDAEAAGIFANYELPVRGSVTREWVARLMNNGIYATKVKYEDGQAQEMYNQDNEPQTFANQDLGLEETTGVLMATPNAQIIDANGENYAGQEDTVANGGKANCVVIDDDGAVHTFKYDAPLNLLGQRVTVLSKGDLDTDVKVYGVTTHKSNIVTTTTVDAVDYDKDDFENGAVLYIDYVENAITYADGKVGNDDFFGENDGRTITLVDYDNNDKYDAAFVNSVVYAEIEYINPSNNIVRFGDMTANATLANIDNEDDYANLVFEDTVAKGDVVKVTKDYTTGKELTVIQKVDVVTGAVTKVTSGGVATIDGSEYKLSTNKLNEYEEIEVSPKAINYYVDGKYVVYSDAISEEEAEQTNIAYIIGIAKGDDEWGKENAKVDILKNDGTREVINYKTDVAEGDDSSILTWEEVKALTFTAPTDNTNLLVEYVMSGGKVYFRTLSDVETATDDYTFDKSESIFTNGTDKYPVNNDTYFFVVDGDNYAVLKTSEINGDMTAMDNTYFAVSSTGLPYVKYAVLEGNATGEASDGIAISATSVSTELDEDGDKVYKLVVTKLDGTEVTLVSNSSTMFDNKTGKFVTYEVGNDGYVDEISVAKPAGYTEAALTVVDGNAVMISENGTSTGAAYKTLADDVKIYYVDAYKSGNNDRIIVSEGDGLVTSAETEADTFAKSVLVKYGTGDEASVITAIIVEVDGQEIPANRYTA